MHAQPPKQIAARPPRIELEPHEPVVLRQRQITEAQILRLAAECGEAWESEVKQIEREMMQRLGLGR
jgi:hypothetical protein